MSTVPSTRSNLPPTALGKGPQHGGLADADISFEQHMAAGKQSDVDQPDGFGLADHGAAHGCLHGQCPGAPLLQHCVITACTETGTAAGVRRARC
jgi:hypothetical protein